MDKQKRVERSGPMLMRDERGNEFSVFAEVTLSRQQYLNGSWSEWQEESRRLFTSDSHVNPPEQGWYEHVTTGTRIRP